MNSPAPAARAAAWIWAGVAPRRPYPMFSPILAANSWFSCCSRVML
jgi:hypothetical protein